MGGRAQLSWRAGLLCLAALAILTFWPALANGFVWDDHDNLVDNPQSQDLRWCLTAFHGGHYQPLTWLSYMADHALWGMEPRGYHLTSLLLHALNAVLFALLARALIRTRAGDAQAAIGGLVAGAIFALHPMRVESVVWVTERRDVLSGLFCLLSLLAYVKNERRWLVVSWVLFLLSLLAKALALGLPVVLLALDWYPLQRSLRRTWPEKVPFAALSALFGWLALRAQEAHGALIDTGSHGWSARIAQAAYGLVYYLRSMAGTWWTPLHERPAVLQAGEARFLLSCVAVLAAAAALLLLRRRVPALVTAAVCYVALVAPVLGVAQSGVQLVADRYSYLACLSWAVVAGAAVAHLVLSRFRWVTLAGTAAVLTFWISSSWTYAKVWHDDDRLWSSVLERGPSAMAANNLGVSALERQDYGAAVERFVEALAILPTYGRAQKNLVDVLEAQPASIPPATLAKAEPVLASMASQQPAARLTFLQGVLAAQRQDWGRAQAHFLQSTTLNPNKTESWEYLGLVRARTGDVEGAVDAYRHATGVDPANGRAWFAIGGLLLQQGRHAEAVAPFRRAAELLPSMSAPLRYLGLCLLRSGDRRGGTEALRQALVRDPHDEEARSLLDRLSPP